MIGVKMMVHTGRSLNAVTDAGTGAVALAISHAADAESTAGAADAARRFPAEIVDAMQRSGLAAATVPVSFGGGGVSQLRDVMAIVERLARGDSSLGIASNMHLSACWSLGRAGASGVERVIPILEATARGKVWITAAVTEHGSNFFHPATTLTYRDGQAILTGTKHFATASPVASHLTVNARIVNGPHDGRLATVVLPKDTPGVEVIDNWAGMGMRASASGQVDFHDAILPEVAVVMPGGPWGRFSAAALVGRALGNVGNLAAMGGIAEAAAEVALRRIQQDGRVTKDVLASRATVQHSVAELEVDLTIVRAVLRDIGAEADRVAALLAPPDGARPTDPTMSDIDLAHRFMATFQATKLTVNRGTVRILDRALDLAGGAGYVEGHPLARRYRDIRAGAFMQPFSPHEALGYIGAVLSGVRPDSSA